MAVVTKRSLLSAGLVCLAACLLGCGDEGASGQDSATGPGASPDIHNGDEEPNNANNNSDDAFNNDAVADAGDGEDEDHGDTMDAGMGMADVDEPGPDLMDMVDADEPMDDAAQDTVEDADLEDENGPDNPDDDEPPPTIEPPPVPEYSHGQCPVLTGGPDRWSSVVTDFPSGDAQRTFSLVVPDNYDGSEPWPVVFGWHYLGGASDSLINHGELERATAERQFIAVLPDVLENEDGDNAYLLDWPFAEFWGIDAELLFFDDLLSCVNDQFNIDTHRIYGLGVSAGALWLSYLSTTERANHFAAIETLSGGLGEVLGVWEMTYTPQPNKFPTMVLWGGEIDWLGLSFHEASLRYQDALVDDDHFVVSCVHDAGHGLPPLDDPEEGQLRFDMLWDFFLAHTYGSPPNSSPYHQSGLPESFPPWCQIASPAP